ncbi:MAG: hypothetical protein HOE45_09690 [Gammaproteobacteria bacterium]|nr:hypothetical protein [Gammaproteobacteria bacterium]
MSNMFLNLILFVFWLWCSVAIYFIILPDKLLAIMVAGLFALVIPLVFFLVAKRNLALVLIILAYIAVTIAWMNMPASNNLDWMPSVAKSPYVITQGNQVTVHDIRNFDYRTETNFTENYWLYVNLSG